VRLGVSVLFEELKLLQPDRLALATPSLALVLKNDSSLLRGEAIGLLGVIGTDEAMKLVQGMRGDPSPQVREMVEMVLEECR
jgi:hypothetical protein